MPAGKGREEGEEESTKVKDAPKRKKEHQKLHQEEKFLAASGREITLSAFDLQPKRAHEAQVRMLVTVRASHDMMAQKGKRSCPNGC